MKKSIRLSGSGEAGPRPNIGPNSFGIVIAVAFLAGISSPELAHGQAQVICSGLGDTACSLAELDQVIIDGFRFYNFASNNIDDPSQFTVTAVGEGTSHPGVRFDVSGDVFSIDRCAPTMPVSKGLDIGYFVANDNDQADSIELKSATLDVGYQADGTGTEANFFGGWVSGTLSYTTSEPAPEGQADFSQFDTSLQTEPPITAKVELPTTIAAINLSLEVGAIVTTFPVPPEECGIRARVTSFEQRVDLPDPDSAPRKYVDLSFLHLLLQD